MHRRAFGAVHCRADARAGGRAKIDAAGDHRLNALNRIGKNQLGIESLFVSLGAAVEEGRGSRIRILLNHQEAVFHRPHPQKETDKGALVSVRKFLENAGVEPLIHSSGLCIALLFRVRTITITK